MNSKEYEQRIEALEREIAALRQEVVEDGSETPMPPHPRWKPEYGNDYYLIGNAGDVYTDGIDGCLLGRGGDIINSRAAIGNIFAKEDEAYAAVMRLKTLAQMREWAGNWDGPYRILYIDGKVEPEAVYIGRCTSYGELRFGSETDAINCIKAVGKDRLKKYYFGVRDHDADDETE